MGYVFIALTVLLTVYGQLVIKWQVLKLGALPAGTEGKLAYLAKALLNPWIVSGLCAAFLASLFWIMAISKLPLSEAYPYTAAGFVVVVLTGAWLFSEPLPALRMVGLGMITIGIILAGRP